MGWDEGKRSAERSQGLGRSSWKEGLGVDHCGRGTDVEEQEVYDLPVVIGLGTTG